MHSESIIKIVRYHKSTWYKSIISRNIIWYWNNNKRNGLRILRNFPNNDLHDLKLCWLRCWLVYQYFYHLNAGWNYLEPSYNIN